MIELADLFGLRYYMLKEESLTSHLVLVKDETGKTATIKLENGVVLDNHLDGEMTKRASETIQNFGDDFLDYWNSLKQDI